MKNQLILGVISMFFLASCGVSNCGCPMTLEVIEPMQNIIEKEIKTDKTFYEKFAIEHKIFQINS